MPFITPIYNRTSADAVTAKANQDSASDLIGALNVSDLNRIESNTEWMHDQLLSYGYSTTVVDIKTDWVEADLMYLDDIDRIRQNVKNVVEAYYALADNPEITLGDDKLTTTHINTLEHNLYNLNIVLQRMLESFRRSGTFRAGQGVILP